MPRRTFHLIVSVTTAAILLAIASTASAQYFGRNKVRYKKLNFQVLETDHFDIYFYPEEREGIDIAPLARPNNDDRWRRSAERRCSPYQRWHDRRSPLALPAQCEGARAATDSDVTRNAGEHARHLSADSGGQSPLAGNGCRT